MVFLLVRAAAMVALVQYAPVRGQPVRALTAADSSRLVRAVRSAQASFESFRRSRLPIGDRMTGPCDVHIGRYCYWRGDDEEGEQPAEPQPVRDRRTSLLTLLDSVASLIPGDAWIDGQFVRYLVEAERYDDALAFTRRCTAGASWCLALAGYAAHSAGRFALADSVFQLSLQALSADERCRWLDVSDVLVDELADRFSRIPCADREAFVRRVMRVASPLYSISTTDLLTEHLARLTRGQIAERAASTDGESWADDQRQLVLRYGWPRWYSRWEPSFGSQMNRSITGHDAGMPFDFLPALHALDHISEVSDDDWHLENRFAVTGYAPAYARSVHILPSQIARFRRGDSTLIVAAWDARRDTTLLGRPLTAALAMLGDTTLVVTRLDSARTVGRLSTIARIDSGIVSLELHAPTEHRAARSRRGIRAAQATRVALSDLLLYSPGDSAVSTIEAARDSALASSEIRGARPLGVFWETYGLRATGEPVHFTLSVEEIGVSWLRRAAERAHLSDPSRGLRVQWQEVPQQHDGIAPRGVRLDLSRLRPGKYQVELAVSADGVSNVVSTRQIEVR
jgi:hypothetical protein